MKTINSKNLEEIIDNSPVAQRQSVPSCDSLKNRIIKETQGLAQNSDSNEYWALFGSVKSYIVKVINSFSNQNIRFQPLTITTAILVLTFIIATDQVTRSPAKSPELFDQTTWEELWLMQDELAFAEL